MSVRNILIHPDPRLRKVCAPVEAVDPALRRLADAMFETMYDAPGIGLAAPQIGVLSRLFVMDCARKDALPEPMALINPVIVWTSEETNTYDEGCLSIPEQYDDVTRPAVVRMRYLDLDGQLQEREFDGIQATCTQHELDHLNGKLFIDYLSKIKRSMITNKMKKLKKERARPE
ncbi:MAG: peptide deformylase [Rhodobacterales bacterium]|nr:peptide deformylase [Pseudomonadota bacterium]MDA1287576.1 peptide deformylase [Pseudomonadota bacterium]